MDIVSLFRSTLIIIAATAFLAIPSYAQYGQYGAAVPSQGITVNKLVGKPGAQTKGSTIPLEFVDNLSISDVRFKPGQDVFFQVRVKNVSGTNLTNAVLKDFLPSFLDPIEGPGNFDGNSRIITVDIGNFAPGEEKVFTFKMRIFPQDKLPADKGVICLTNKVQASGTVVTPQPKADPDTDTAQFCLEKEVAGGVTTVPSAGPGLGLPLLALETTILAFGIYLRKKTIS